MYDFDIFGFFWHSGDGDGTVNRESLEYCGNWNGTPSHSGNAAATLFPFPGVDHMTVLQNKAVLAEIAKLIPILANWRSFLPESVALEFFNFTVPGRLFFVFFPTYVSPVILSLFFLLLTRGLLKNAIIVGFFTGEKIPKKNQVSISWIRFFE